MKSVSRATPLCAFVMLMLVAMCPYAASAVTLDEAEAAYERGDYATALAGFRKHAGKGNHHAQKRLGNLYDHGHGVLKNHEEAARWYRRAAEQGNAPAQYNLGLMYSKGKGVPKDYIESVRWYRLAAEQGQAEAQNNLGAMYADGRGVPKDKTEAIRWYRLAADQGYAIAQNNLGYRYSKGEGVPKDGAQAMRWFRLAAEQGNVYAHYKLGEMYYFGDGVPENNVEAMRWLRVAADGGYSNAQYYLGWLYERADDIPRDYAQALQWYRKAAEQKHVDAQYNLGKMNYYGIGVAKNYTQSAHWYRLAAEQGHADAQNELGVMYGSGRGVPKEQTEAIRWYRLAAEQGQVTAQLNLGRRYHSGHGVPQDESKAAHWYRLAAEQGHAIAQYTLARSYYTGSGVPEDHTESARWHRAAAEQGLAIAQYELGLLYSSGHGVPQDEAKAAHWYRLAADQGDADIQFFLAERYDWGRGVAEDGLAAEHYYRLAADQGHDAARTALADLEFVKSLNPDDFWKTWKSKRIFAKLRPRAIARLLADGRNPNARFRDHTTPLHKAILRSDPAVVRALLLAGANPNLSVEGLHPLVAAMNLGRLPVVEVLLNGGADPILESGRYPPPFLKVLYANVSSPSGWKALLDMYSKFGIDLKFLTSGKWGHFDLFNRALKAPWAPGLAKARLESLRDAGAGPRERSLDGETLLAAAACSDWGYNIFNVKAWATEVTRTLTSAKFGIDPNARDSKGRTALYCFFSQPEWNEPLVKSGADSRVRDADGQTPLHHAIDQINAKVKRAKDIHEDSMLLVHAGFENNKPGYVDHVEKRLAGNLCDQLTQWLNADLTLNVGNDHGETPLQYARRSNAPQPVIRVLEIVSKSASCR